MFIHKLTILSLGLTLSLIQCVQGVDKHLRTVPRRSRPARKQSAQPFRTPRSKPTSKPRSRPTRKLSVQPSTKPRSAGPWPECLGMECQECRDIIGNLTVTTKTDIHIVPYGALVTSDVRSNRVRIFCDRNSLVSKIPKRG